jgi:hypothetical protein
MNEQGEPLRLNEGRAGKSGRRKFVFTDYDADGQLDLIVDSKPNLDFWRNIGSQSEPRFRNEGPVAERVLCGHDCCPTTVDFDGDGRRELLVGAEDGYLYYLPR